MVFLRLAIIFLSFFFIPCGIFSQTISTHPLNLQIAPGDTASFTVVASGSALNYQWQKNNMDISGATAAVFGIPNVVHADTGTYRCIVSNLSGSDTSLGAYLSIEQYTEQSGISLTGIYSCYGNTALDWGDYDNDGDLDILLAGYTHVYGHNSGPKITKVYKNNGNNTFTEQSGISLTDFGDAAAKWGDYDNDGDLDILICGWFNGNYNITEIYRNDGSNVFAPLSALSIQQSYCGYVDWGDYDNDGDLDFLITGDYAWGIRVSKVYENVAQDSFIEQTSIVLTGVGGDMNMGSSSCEWGDYDNDGDLDILLGGFLSGGAGGNCWVYRNDGNNVFTGILIASIYVSSCSWGDYDNDGDLDFIISGHDGSNYHTKIYRNFGNSTFVEQSSISLTGVVHSSVMWGDYDNDGDLDVLLTGNSGSGFITKIYDNEGGNVFAENGTLNLPGVHKGKAIWGDYDNDGDLDILLSGHDGSNAICKLFRNNEPIINNNPQSPSGLSAVSSGYQASLIWNTAADDHTPSNTLFYNVMIGSTNSGTDIKSPMSDSSSGFRRIVKMGNACLKTSWTIDSLPVGVYYWSVQSVDQAYKGSVFAAVDSFSIGIPVITQHPQDIHACEGDSVCFYLPATGDSLNYQWFRNDTLISGATNSILCFTNIDSGDMASYSCVISNSYGNDSSEAADLYVYGTATYYEQQNICEGDSAFLAGSWQLLAGSYYDTLVSAIGCDSIIITDLTVYPSFTDTIPLSLCGNDSLPIVGGYAHTSGIYLFDTNTSQHGCDSSIYVDLSFYPEFADTIPLISCGDTLLPIVGGSAIATGIYLWYYYLSDNACDSLVYLDLTIAPEYYDTIPLSICPHDSVLTDNGYVNSPGIHLYIDSFTDLGCDSLTFIDLSHLPVYYDTLLTDICKGDSLPVVGGYASISGLFLYETHANSSGCDSNIYINLNVHPVWSDTINMSICEDSAMQIVGGITNTSGTYLLNSGSTANGCDSLTWVDLQVYPVFMDTLSLSICQGDSVQVQSGFATSSGINLTYQGVSNQGCDSLIYLDLSVYPNKYDTLLQYICQGDSIQVYNGYAAGPGIYLLDSLTTAYSCDSILWVDLRFWPSQQDTVSITICENDSVQVMNGFAQTSGFYLYDSTTNIFGCDSITYLDLTVYPVFADTIHLYHCGDTAIPYIGGLASTSGLYLFDTASTQYGCDSLTYLDIKVYPAFEDTLYQTVCYGDSVQVYTGYAFNTGTYLLDTFQTAYNCDSITYLDLYLHPVYADTVNLTICDDDSLVTQNGYVSTPGVYLTYFGLTAENCDSLIYTNLSIAPSYADTVAASICQGDSLAISSGYAYNSGIYLLLDTIGHEGCDSVLYVDVAVYPTAYDTIQMTICDGDSMQLQNGYASTTGLYLYDSLMTNTYNCDSIVFLALIVNPTFSDTISLSICDGDSLQIVNGYASTAGMYLFLDTLSVQYTCDSLVYADISVNPKFQDTLIFNICEGDSMAVSNGYADSSGVYILLDTVSSLTSCDSMLFADLTVYPVNSDTLSMDICQGDSVMLVNGFATTTGYYIYQQFTNAMGCDSSIVLDLYAHTLPMVELPGDTSICSDDTLMVFIDNTYSSFSWQDGSSVNPYSITNPGLYWVYVTDSNNCAAYDSLFVEVIKRPNVTLQQYAYFCEDELVLNPRSDAGYYLWQDGSMSKFYFVNDTGTYWVMVSNSYFTDTSDCLCCGFDRVTLRPCAEIWLPNTFTPNEDGLNDIFLAIGFEVRDFEIYIYNRWGELVFESDDIMEGWDGTIHGEACPQGVYHYVMKYSGVGNVIMESEGGIVTGHILLIR